MLFFEAAEQGVAMEIGWRDSGPRPVGGDDRLALAQPFFATASAPCPYVPGRVERKLIVELPDDGDAPAVYDHLSRVGFRRSHRFAYRPACRSCAACVPVRIAVSRFAHSRSTRRVWSVNRDLTGRLVAAQAEPEHYQLFVAYQRSRHRTSEMAAMSFHDYRAMVEETPIRTAIAEFRDGTGALAAAVLVDRVDDGLSAVYSYFDPARRRQSLGTWSILWMIEECRRRGLAHVYLGYWIAESPKMAYKARFPALERLSAGGWIALAEAP